MIVDGCSCVVCEASRAAEGKEQRRRLWADAFTLALFSVGIAFLVLLLVRAW